jgi:hypothetical protein
MPRWNIDVDAGGLAMVAPPIADSPLMWTGGGVLRAGLMVSRFGVALGVSGLAPSSVPGQPARMVRVPVDVSARLSLRRGRFEGLFDLGFLGAALIVDGSLRRDTRFEAGARAAAMLRAWLHDRIALFASVEADAVATPYSLLVGDMRVASTPPLWLGVAIGVTARMR